MQSTINQRRVSLVVADDNISTNSSNLSPVPISPCPSQSIQMDHSKSMQYNSINSINTTIIDNNNSLNDLQSSKDNNNDKDNDDSNNKNIHNFHIYRSSSLDDIDQLQIGHSDNNHYNNHYNNRYNNYTHHSHHHNSNNNNFIFNRFKKNNRGSIPMIGSLVYYKPKSLKNNTNSLINDNNSPPFVPENAISDSENDNDNDDEILPLSPTQSIYEDLNDDNDEHEHDDHDTDKKIIRSRHCSSPEMHHIFISHHHHLKDFNPIIPIEDEFNIINNKISSQIISKTKEFEKNMKLERRKSHLINKLYHIPHLDPEPTPSPSPSPSISNINEIINDNQINIPEPKSAIECQQSDNKPNGRHRRRLTCAMIFTRPKVVEI